MPTAAPPGPKILNIRGTGVGIPRLEPGTAVVVSTAQAAGIHDAIRDGRLDPAVEVILSERYGLTMLDARTGAPLDGGSLSGVSPEERPNVRQGHRDSLPAQKTNVARVGAAIKTHGAQLVILSEAVVRAHKQATTRQPGTGAYSLAVYQGAFARGDEDARALGYVEWATKAKLHDPDAEPIEVLRQAYEGLDAPVVLVRPNDDLSYHQQGIDATAQPFEQLNTPVMPTIEQPTVLNPDAGPVVLNESERSKMGLAPESRETFPWRRAEVHDVGPEHVRLIVGPYANSLWVGANVGRVAVVEHNPPASFTISDTLSTAWHRYPDAGLQVDAGPLAWMRRVLLDLIDEQGRLAPSLVLIEPEAADVIGRDNLSQLANELNIALGVMDRG